MSDKRLWTGVISANAGSRLLLKHIYFHIYHEENMNSGFV